MVNVDEINRTVSCLLGLTGESRARGDCVGIPLVPLKDDFGFTLRISELV